MEQHPVLACVAAVEQALSDASGVPVEFMTRSDKAAALTQLAPIASRLESLRLRLLACADDVARDAGARDIAAWTAATTHTEATGERRALRLANALDARCPALGRALADARVNPDQAHIIAAALDALPDQLDRETLQAAETRLIRDAAEFGPRELRVLGRRILDIVAPEIAEEHERKLLENEEADAEAAVSLTRCRVRPGVSRFEIRVPDPIADRLLTYLEAFTSPRQRDTQAQPDAARLTEEGAPTDTGAEARIPRGQALGRAFCALVESYDPHRLPLHGGDATTVIINIDYETLSDDVNAATHSGATYAPPAPTACRRDTASEAAPAHGARSESRSATYGTDGRMTPGQLRRLACTANIIPMVLGTRSEPLDMGRAARLFSRAQRKAMAIRDRACRAQGCDIPAPWTEAHHYTKPWAPGGLTNLADGLLLCRWHHQRIHDHHYTHTQQPNGQLTFQLTG